MPLDLAKKKLGDYPPADPLTGAEEIPVIQDGRNRNTTTQAVADMAADQILLPPLVDDAVAVIDSLARYPKRIATVAALRVASLDDLRGQSIQLDGYYSVGDGAGGPPFRLVEGAAPGTYVENGGSVIVLDGGVGSVAAIRSITGRIDSRWFGAKGDGIQNDHPFIMAAINSVDHGMTSKGCAEIYCPSTSAFYRLEQTLDLTERWNILLVGDNTYMSRRTPAVPSINDPTATFHWYGNTTDPMIKFDYTFGSGLKDISLHGRDVAKIGVAIAPLVIGQASVTRGVRLENIGINTCDFGIVIGDVTAGTDNGPVEIINPYITNCKTNGILIQSGNAWANIYGGMIVNNGYDPSTDVPFMPYAGISKGAQIQHFVGFLTINGTTFDFDLDHVVADSTIYQIYGSCKINGAWDDSPEKPFYIGETPNRPTYFNGVTHYDASMTLASTPESIIYQGAQPLVLESCYLYGNVQLLQGQGASVTDIGTVFARAGAGFTGAAITVSGGIVSTTGGRLTVGAEPKTILGGYQALIESENRTSGLVRGIRGDPFKVVEVLTSDQTMIQLGNARYDHAAGKYYALAAGTCWINYQTNNRETVAYDTAVNAGDEVTFPRCFHGWMYSATPNAMPMLVFNNQRISYGATPPASGAWTLGDIFFSLSPAINAPVGWVCTVAGTPGTWQPFGVVY